ncbi:MAG: DUF5659 domain-containing protein [Bacilli bacterium]|nr:DUF5659 domain-containing protein [Bacilli bacterium]
MRNKKETWKVSHVPIIAYLLSDGLEIIETEIYKNGDREFVDFVFKNSKELHQSIRDYKENNFIQEYYNNIQKVRNMIYQAKKKNS